MRPDLRLDNGLILTMNDRFEVVDRGFVEICGSHITAVGRMSELINRPQPHEVLDISNHLVMPGLINCHTHAAMTLIRGMADDMPLDTWLRDFIWPAEARFVTAENVFTGTQLAIAEMFRSGTTLFADMYFFEEEVARACIEAGMKVLTGEAVMDFPSPSHPAPESTLKHTESMATQYRNHPLVRVAFAPHSIYACSKSLLQSIAKESRRLNLPVHIHLSETDEEVTNSLSGNGLRPLPYLLQTGINERLIAAHMIHTDQKEIELAATLDMGIAHNPSSNMKLASGWAPIDTYTRLNIKCGLGTDGAASNNNLNLFNEMRSTALVTKLLCKDPAAMPARKVVEMATIGGARVLGVDRFTGSIEAGKAADILVARLDQPHLTPLYNIWSHVVYAMHSSDVETLFVNGRMVMHKRVLQTLDIATILAKASKLNKKIQIDLFDSK